jgi:transcriptional regulator with PAS, ATPase and Fis domain
MCTNENDEIIQAVNAEIADFERNIGELGILFSRKSGKTEAVHAFEPSVETGAEAALCGVRAVTSFALSLAKAFADSSGGVIKEIENVHSRYCGNDKKTKPSYGADDTTGLLAESPAMKRIMDVVERIKDTDSTVLISGESGVGKSVLAKYIHTRSRRARAPFVEINCGAIPEQLLESELFGYNSGAFTGASSTGKEGLAEMAANGTLLLDEISELPFSLQVKLLNLIQEKRILRIGAKKPIRVDVRIIAASNKDLGELVEKGLFRADLFYRLNVIPIYIPPLRERREDIAPAVALFAEKFQKKYKKQIICSKDFTEKMQNRNWNGNIRELENAIERMVLMSEDGVLSPMIMDSEDEHTTADRNDFSNLKEFMESQERRIVRAAYERGGSSYKVAEALGISQTSAHRKLRKHLLEYND